MQEIQRCVARFHKIRGETPFCADECRLMPLDATRWQPKTARCSQMPLNASTCFWKQLDATTYE
eukprot:6214714-Pleurochrysis_carterae.AAC.3